MAQRILTSSERAEAEGAVIAAAEKGETDLVFKLLGDLKSTDKEVALKRAARSAAALGHEGLLAKLLDTAFNNAHGDNSFGIVVLSESLEAAAMAGHFQLIEKLMPRDVSTSLYKDCLKIAISGAVSKNYFVDDQSKLASLAAMSNEALRKQFLTEIAEEMTEDRQKQLLEKAAVVRQELSSQGKEVTFSPIKTYLDKLDKRSSVVGESLSGTSGILFRRRPTIVDMNRLEVNTDNADEMKPGMGT